MKILYVAALNETINAFLIPHIERLIELGNTVDCACNINMDIDEKLNKLEVKYYNINFERNPVKINYLKVIRDIKNVYRKNNYDIVHVHTPIAAFLTRFALRKEKVKIIYTAHGFHFYKGAPIINWILYYPLERIAAHWTDKLITINTEDFNRSKLFKLRDNGKTLLMHGVGITKEQYEVNKFDKEQYRKNINISKDDFVLLILADVNYNKNHIQIIKAMKLINKKDNNIKVICAGEGPLKEKLINKVKKMKLEDKISFLGFRSDVKELLHISDCIGLFSKREGLGKCLLEGMITGKSLIATDTRGPRELIEDNKNGFLVEIGDYKSTARAIERLSQDRKLRMDFYIESQDKLKKYLLNNVLEFIENVY